MRLTPYCTLRAHSEVVHLVDRTVLTAMTNTPTHHSKFAKLIAFMRHVPAIAHSDEPAWKDL
jgi:hypothetical protein